MRTHILIFLLLLPALAQAQVYRWVDETGKVQYSDKPPPPNAKNVQKKSMSSGTGSAPLPYAVQEAVKNFPVTLYTSGDCKEYCVQARQLLDKRGVPYKEILVSDARGIEELKRLSSGNTVPVMSVGREVHKGFESSSYNAALDIAGYPRTSLLPPGRQAQQLVKPPALPAEQPAPTADGKTPPAETPQQKQDGNTPK